MKKNLFIFLIASFSYIFCGAQNNNEVTVLFLLPFHLNESADISSIRNSSEIHQERPFEMMGFWLGAKMALQEYENSDKTINVIVRDAVTDARALNRILNDSVLMSPVNIIIGPLYGSIFPVAAEYARKHNIIIVNPFSTRYDFVAHNPAVYKLVPPYINRPETIENVFLSHPNNYNIILWGDSVTTPELIAYKYYFDDKNIYYNEIHTDTLPDDWYDTNLIIALFDEPARVIQSVHSLVNHEAEKNVFVTSDKWFSVSELTEDFYNLPYLYYFSNNFVDNYSSEVKLFQSDHIFYYDAPAEISAYSYQGYDITRYFIDLHYVDYDFEKVQFSPLSYKFQWKQIPDGGFENQKVRFVRASNFVLEEVR
jgi:hypothetical protein